MTQLPHLLPLAQMDRFSGLRDRFGAHRTHFDINDALTGVLLLALVVGAILLLGKFAARQDRQRTCNSPRKLFRNLCRAHELDRASRKLLRRLARWQALAQPARLFLEVERFDEANVSPELLTQLPKLLAIRDRLFDAQGLLLEEQGAALEHSLPVAMKNGTDVAQMPTDTTMPAGTALLPANARQASANLAHAAAQSSAIES